MPAIIAAILAMSALFMTGLTTIGEAFTVLTGLATQLVNFLNPYIILIDAISGLTYVLNSIYELFTSLSS
jgi:hypothetical protein